MFLYDLRDEQPLHIMVPDGIKIIEQYAFGSAIPTSNRILSITLPDSVTTIAQSALSCLTMRYIRLPRNLTEITYSMISYTYYVNELDADFSKVTTIGKEAFYSMSKNVNISRYNKIELPSIQTIESTAFYGCKYYSEIVLGPNCTSIGNNAFQNSSFRIITVHATTPPTLTSNISNAEHIYVPAESVQTYKTTSRWSYYEDIIEAIQ